MHTRRQFVEQAPLGILAAIAACRGGLPEGASPPAPAAAPPGGATPGAPPTFGTAPGVGTEVTPATFEDAERLVQWTMTPAERAQAAGSWRRSLAPLMERRTGPRKVQLPEAVGGETILTIPDLRTRGPGRLQVRSVGRVTEIEFIDLVPVRRTTATSNAAGRE